ncbi:MAG: hypothetical protein IT423_12090 [Pirellulaceae bacterium]|nr:hypothetical protein [Pirellulaceae bacterium]
MGWISILLAIAICWACSSGCSLMPDIRHKPQYNNPFPQLRTVAVLPFVNQSEEATLSAERVTLAYINELQAIPGFEVLPMGVVKARLEEYSQPLSKGEDFQALARDLGVDAVLLGSVIDYSPYYPPRMSMKVNWYAANPGFHPVLPGYGMPWGTKDEKKIPRWVHHEAQRALATEQLKSQTPELTAVTLPVEAPQSPPVVPPPALMPEDQSDGELVAPASAVEGDQQIAAADGTNGAVGSSALSILDDPLTETLPTDWPDPRGFIPATPTAMRPPLVPQHEPIIAHMRNYNGHDEDFTRRVSDYFYFRDDVRFGGWQAYLQRSEDFIRVCCHFHVTETLACRGGEEESRLIFRWPLDRYQR